MAEQEDEAAAAEQEDAVAQPEDTDGEEDAEDMGEDAEEDDEEEDDEEQRQQLSKQCLTITARAVRQQRHAHAPKQSKISSLHSSGAPWAQSLFVQAARRNSRACWRGCTAQS